MKTLKKGQRVRYRGYEVVKGQGICVKALKTRWHIEFADGSTMVFDKEHLQFLDSI